MSALRPINTHGPFIPFMRPAPVPSAGVGDSPQVSIAFNEAWIPVVFSALKALCRPETWEGTQSEIIQAVKDAHQLFDFGGTSMPIGTIVPHVLASLPSNWLNCDGSTHNRVDYPALYALLDSAYVIDADHFKTPDLRGRMPIGVGSGSGLTTRAVDASGGTETHVLSVAELATHHHNRNSDGQSELTMWTKTPKNHVYPTGTDQQTVFLTVTGDAGSSSPHENMSPFRAVKYAVVAG